MNDGPEVVTPDEIESDIVRTRTSLNHKIDELQRRLSPTARLREVRRDLRRRFDPAPYVGLAATAAIATGTYLAIKGWREVRRRNSSVAFENLMDDAATDLASEETAPDAVLTIEECIVGDPLNP